MSVTNNVHYVVDVRVLKVTTSSEVEATGNGPRPSNYHRKELGRVVAEIAHVVVSDRALPALITKAGHHLALVDGDADIDVAHKTTR